MEHFIFRARRLFRTEGHLESSGKKKLLIVKIVPCFVNVAIARPLAQLWNGKLIVQAFHHLPNMYFIMEVQVPPPLYFSRPILQFFQIL